RAPAPADADADVQDAVFLAEGRPYLIRLHLYTGGRPLRHAWDEFLAMVFNAADQNRGGVIGADGGGQLPAGQTAVGIPPAPVPRGKQLRRADLAELFRRAGAGPLQFQNGGGGQFGLVQRLVINGDVPTPDADGITAALFRLLDANGDGVLSPEEIDAA